MSHVIDKSRWLETVHALVRMRFPGIDLYSAKVYRYQRVRWEFSGPDNFYWVGYAACATEARARGWLSYLLFKKRGGMP